MLTQAAVFYPFGIAIKGKKKVKVQGQEEDLIFFAYIDRQVEKCLTNGHLLSSQTAKRLIRGKKSKKMKRKKKEPLN